VLQKSVEACCWGDMGGGSKGEKKEEPCISREFPQWQGNFGGGLDHNLKINLKYNLESNNKGGS